MQNTPPRIRFNRPVFLREGLENIMAAIEAGHVAGDGAFTRRCEELMRDALGVPEVLLTTSCTHSLEIAAMLLDIAPGDEVVLPTFTFASTASAFVMRGATPVFVDIRPDTLNIDDAQLEAAITPRTRAIVVVHYAGVACPMDRILEIAQRHGIPVVEDNAHGLFGKYRGRWLGTFGCLATQSFHETKNFSCGEGGALLVNDSRFAERGAIIREKGTNRRKFFQGLVDKYSWVDLGSSYVPSDLLAACLEPQLKHWPLIQRRRQEVWERYDRELRAWAGENGVRLPVIPAECEQSFHIFYLILPTAESRRRFIEEMRAVGITAVFHYLPLNESPMGEKLKSAAQRPCPVARDMSDRLVRLPLFYDLSPEDQSRVIAEVTRFRP